MTYLIADSGSTKTSWAFIEDDGHRTDFETEGINPVRDSDEKMKEVIASLLIPCPAQIFFYGAGCIPPYSETLCHLLQQKFPQATVRVDSDLLGAAHALCGKEEGIVCILGTGSNSCLYDGEKIVENVSPLGYILGDEGSGAVLGKTLIGDLLKGGMSESLRNAFFKETGLTRAQIIDKVYRQPMANRFLASLVPFLERHRIEMEIHTFLVTEFRRFFQRNVAHYHRPDLHAHFVGGVAHTFQDELSEAAILEGVKMGRILKRPIDGMAAFVTCHR